MPNSSVNVSSKNCSNLLLSLLGSQGIPLCQDISGHLENDVLEAELPHPIWPHPKGPFKMGGYLLLERK